MTSTTDPRSSQTESLILAQTRVLQIVVGALVIGVSIFAGYVILSGTLQKPPQGAMLSTVAVGFGALMVVMHFVVPGVIERAALANQAIGADRESLVRVYFTRTIIAAALLEGAAFMSLVAVMNEHQPWVLGVTAVILVFMLMQIPSRTRIEHWLESKMMEREQGT